MRRAVIYRRLIRPLLYLLPAEAAHHLVFTMMRVAAKVPGARAAAALTAPSDDALRVDALGLSFSSPVGLAAGFDKDAAGIDALAALGFGFLEVGTLTAEPQPGNPKPRLFRLPRDHALVNRLGFNNRGAADAARRLARRRAGVVVGVNVGKTKAVPDEGAVDDYVRSVELCGAHADYLVVNVSSPNTPGLRDLQAVERLGPLLGAVREALDRTASRRVALLVKIAPDLSDADVDAVVDLCLQLGIDGMVVTNTTVARGGLRTPSAEVASLGTGGLSGRPLKARSLEVLRRVRARAGERLVLIAVGGIESADDAWDRIRAGATLVQLYTALVYEGPALPRRIARGLARRAREAGFARVQDAVGSGG
jgi:dihydroorotate dehydrogenase